TKFSRHHICSSEIVASDTTLGFSLDRRWCHGCAKLIRAGCRCRFGTTIEAHIQIPLASSAHGTDELRASVAPTDSPNWFRESICISFRSVNGLREFFHETGDVRVQLCPIQFCGTRLFNFL